MKTFFALFLQKNKLEKDYQSGRACCGRTPRVGMQPNGHHLHEHFFFFKASISNVCLPVCVWAFECVHVQSRKPGANASRQIGGTRWESGTFLRDDKPSQSHTSRGMLGKQSGWAGGAAQRGARRGEAGRTTPKDAERRKGDTSLDR